MLIYAKKGVIKQSNNEINFKLIDGFRTELKKDNIENLKFDTYLASFPINEKKIYNKYDQNTLDIFELTSTNNERHRTIIFHRLIDTLIILTLSLFFYFNIIKKNNFNLINLIIFIVISILCVSIDSLLENLTFKDNIYIVFLFFNLLAVHFFSIFFRFMKY